MLVTDIAGKRMDFKKIFMEKASPTKIGGQAVLEGVMMKGEDRTAIVVRADKGRMFIKTEKLPQRSKAAEIPIIRGVYIFVTTLMMGMKTLIYSAEVLERLLPEEEPDENAAAEDAGKEAGKEKKEEKGLPFGVMIAISVAIAIAFVVGVFIIVPTIVVNFLGVYTDSAVILNIVEGIMRIVFFVVYIVVISRMKDIQTTFQYHGAEHQTIHCFENGRPLTPAEASQFETLHPRCGTSFLMFVMIIALLVFSMLGWPDLVPRILSRIVFIPLIAGLSFELLRFAGSRDTPLVRILSVPGLLLQKLTTRVPDDSQLEVAISALNAVIVPPDTQEIEGYCDNNVCLVPEEPEVTEETDVAEEAEVAEVLELSDVPDFPNIPDAPAVVSVESEITLEAFEPDDQ